MHDVDQHPLPPSSRIESVPNYLFYGLIMVDPFESLDGKCIGNVTIEASPTRRNNPSQGYNFSWACKP